MDRINTRVPAYADKPSGSRIGLIIATIILAVVVIALIVIVIILLIRRQQTASKNECNFNTDCSSGKICFENRCISDTSPPNPPSNVKVEYDIIDRSATVSWDASPGAKSYNIYRKLEDPSVGVNNYVRKEATVNTNFKFVTLDEGTHYFVVTALNAFFEESEPSHPVVLAPSCGSLPTTMASPIVSQSSNDCGVAPLDSEEISISFPNMTIPDGFYVIEGTGQVGSVSNYFYIIQGSSWGPANGMRLKCGGLETKHKILQITDFKQAELTVSGPVTTGDTFQMTWKAIVGSEEYFVFLVGVNGDGVPHFYGGYAKSTDTSLILNTNSGDNLYFGIVLGYKLCDKSLYSSETTYITA